MSRPRRNAAAAEGAPAQTGTLSSYFRNIAKGAAAVPGVRAAAAVGAAVVQAAALDEEELREEDEDEEEEEEPVFEEEEVNVAVEGGVAEKEQRKDERSSARKKIVRKKRERATAPDDLRACCFVFFRAAENDEDQDRWYCLANPFQPCSGSVKKKVNAIAKTGNFVDHCQSNHADWYALVESSFKEKGKVGAETQFQTLLNGAKSRAQVNQPLSKFGFRAAKAPGKMQKELRLLLWAIKCNVPFSRFDDPTWTSFVGDLGATLCGSKQLMRLVEPLYAIVEKLVTKEIAKAVAVSTAMDFWTSVAGDHYLGLTYHWMDSELNLRAALLDCIPFPGQAFGDTIATVADARWDLHFKNGAHPEPMRGAIVSDRGANVRAARDALVPNDSENCFCHLLDSTVRSVYAEDGQFHAVDFYRDLLLIDTLAKGLRAQPMHLRAFQLKCPAGVAHLTVVTDQTTRWEALVRECERALALREGFNAFFHDRVELKDSIGRLCPTDVFEGTYWARLESYKHLLQQFRIASTTSQSESEPTLCRVVKMIIGLEQLCSASVGDAPLWSSVKKRFRLAIQHFLRPEIDKLCNCTKACLLDPRNHACEEWLGEVIYKEAWEELEKEAAELYPAPAGEEEHALSIIKGEMGLLRRRMEALWKNGSNKEPIMFLKENAVDLQRVIKVAAMYLSIPASAAKPERVWSYTGWLVTKQRNPLGVDMVEAMAFIWDFTRQPFFDFDDVLMQVEELVKLHEESEADKAAARKEVGAKRAKNAKN